MPILSIEKEIAADIDLTSVVCEFSEAKARRGYILKCHALLSST